MAINEYDDLLEGGNGSGGGGNEYANLLNEQKDLQKTELQASMFAAKDKVPDHQAQVQGLAAKMKLAPELVERNFDELNKHADQSQHDYEDIVNSSPKVAEWLSNPNNAALAKDDIPNLQALEDAHKEYGTMRTMFNALTSGVAGMNAGLARLPGTAMEAAAYPGYLIQKQFDDNAKPFQAPDSLFHNPITAWADKGQQDSRVPDMNTDVMKALSSGDYSKAGRALAVQFVANAPMQASMIAASFVAGPQAGLSMGGGIATSTHLQELKDQGVPMENALPAAIANGMFEAAFENLGTFSILKSWEKQVAKTYGKGLSKEVVGSAMKSLLYSVAAEGNEEFWTSAAQDYTDYITDANPDALKDMWSRAAGAGLIGAASGGLLTAPSGVMGAQAKIKQASIAKDFYASLGNTAEASRLRERLPEAQRQVVEKITQGTDVEHIYVPVEAMKSYFQSQNVNASEAVQNLGITKEFEEAQESGIDVKIPLAHWVQNVVGTEHYKGLQNDVKFSPEDLTFNEAEAEHLNLQTQMRSEFDISQLPQGDSQFHESAKAVGEDLIMQLRAAGQDDQTARFNAMQMETTIRTFAQREGLDPMELYKRYQPQILGPNDQEGANVVPLFEAKEFDDKGVRTYRPEAIQAMRQSIDRGEVIQRGTIKGDDGEVTGNYGGSSTFPEYFQNKGYTKAAALKIIDKQAAGKPLTEQQQAIFDDLYEGHVDGLQRGQLFQFAGRTAQNAPVQALVKANDMASKGVGSEQIRKDTGWFKGQDNRWRFEISDEKAKLKEVKFKSGQVFKLEDILDHPQLFAAYPGLRDMGVKIATQRGRVKGTYSLSNRVLQLNVSKIPQAGVSANELQEFEAMTDTEEYLKFLEIYNSAGPKTKQVLVQKWKETGLGKRYFELKRIVDAIPMSTPKTLPADELTTVLHEIQHAIQHIEGFANGTHSGKTKFSKRRYFNTHGEIEARDTEARKSMSDTDRSATAPAITGWKNPVLNWGGVTTELPIDDMPAEVSSGPVGEQMRLFQGPAVDMERERIKRETTLKFTPLAGLNGVQREQEELAAWLLSQSEAEANYAKIEDTQNGKLIDVDAARSLLPKFAESKEGATVHTMSTHAPMGTWAWNLYLKRLAMPVRGPVFLAAGGTGAGKSTMFKYLKGMMAEAEIAFDGTLQNREGSIERVEKALESGRPVYLNFVFRDVREAAGVEGVAGRFEKTGRMVSAKGVVESHVNSLENFIHLIELYRNNPMVQIKVLDNTTKTMFEITNLDDLKKKRYHDVEAGETASDAIAKLMPQIEGILANAQAEADTRISRAEEAFHAGRSSSNVQENERDQQSRDDTGELREGQASGSEQQDSVTKLNQSDNSGARGRIQWNKSRKFRIDLFAKADLSTFIHESGHFYQEILADLATAENASPQIKADYETVLKWFGVNSRAEVTEEHHEMWARAFEQYLMEGKAPNAELREAFSRFKVWLVAVYKNLKNLNVEITPEIRDVMARMMATEESIQQAEDNDELKPLFDDAIAAGMNEAQAKRYAEAREAAKLSAEERLNKKLNEAHLRQKTAYYKAREQEVRASVEAEVNKDPVYQALSILSRGKLADGTPLPEGMDKMKLDRASLVAKFGDQVLKALPRGLYAREGGVDASVVAEILGFKSAQEMVDAFTKAEKKSDLIDRQTKEQMAAQFPDALTDGTMSDETRKALHNDAKEELLRMELEHLASNNLTVLKDTIKRVARRVPSKKDIRAQAERTIGSKTIAEIRPIQFQRAEVKASKEAGEALAKGDFQGAFEAKRRELINHELYRAAVEAREFVEKSNERFAKFKQSDEKIAKSRDMDLVNAGRAVLAQFGIGKPGKPAADYLEAMSKYDPDTYQTMISLIASASENPGPIKETKFDDFVAMHDAVTAMWDLARANKEMEIDGRIVDRQQIMDELVAQLHETGTKEDKVGLKRALTDKDKWKMKYLGIKAALRRVESWARATDGGEAGAFSKYFVQPVMDATTKYRLDQKTQIEKFLSIITPIKESLVKREIDSPELGYQFNSKSEILGALLHTGNDSNFQKLLLGRGWGELDANGALSRTRWNGFVERMIRENILTKQDFDVVQQIWDLMEETKPQAQVAHKKMYGFYFNEITANTVKNSLGEWRGGYMPAVVDSLIAEDAAIRADKNALDGAQNSFMFPTTGRGFTKSRVEYNAPLALDLRLVPAHLDKVMRFVHIEPVVKQIGRVIMDKGFRSELGSFDPQAAQDMLVPWLQRTASQQAIAPSQGQAGKALDKVASLLRGRAGLQTMVLNTVNAIQNFAGVTLAAVRVPPTKIASAMGHYLTGPRKMTEYVTSKSDFMKTKVGEQAFDIHKAVDEILLDPSTGQKVKDAAIKHGYVMQIVTQNVMEVTTWAAAYNHATAQGMSELEAIRFSDNVVRETQGDMSPEGVSRAETGTAFQRLFTQFYSYFNMHANLLGTQGSSIMQEAGLGKKLTRGSYLYLMGFAAPAIIVELISRVMSGSGIDEDDDGEYAIDILSIIFGSQFRLASAMIPGGAIPATVVNVWNDKSYDDKISTPVAGAIEKTARAPLSVYKALFKDGSSKMAIQDSLTAIGMLTGYPMAALGRPAGYLADVSEGKTEPTGPIDFARGVITGKGPKN